MTKLTNTPMTYTPQENITVRQHSTVTNLLIFMQYINYRPRLSYRLQIGLKRMRQHSRYGLTKNSVRFAPTNDFVNVATRKLLSGQQHGFMAKRSTVTNLLDCFSDWTLSSDNRHLVTVADFDYSKTFDMLSPSKITQTYRRQRHRGCRDRREHIPDNIWSAGDEISYPPKFVKIVIKLPAELMRIGATSVCGTSKTPRQSERKSDRPSPYFERHPLRTFRLCLYTSGLMRDECQSHTSC